MGFGRFRSRACLKLVGFVSPFRGGCNEGLRVIGFLEFLVFLVAVGSEEVFVLLGFGRLETISSGKLSLKSLFWQVSSR